eukprot:2474618-Rhodomonas_salina.1
MSYHLGMSITIIVVMIMMIGCGPRWWSASSVFWPSAPFSANALSLPPGPCTACLVLSRKRKGHADQKGEETRVCTRVRCLPREVIRCYVACLASSSEKERSRIADACRCCCLICLVAQRVQGDRVCELRRRGQVPPTHPRPRRASQPGLIHPFSFSARLVSSAAPRNWTRSCQDCWRMLVSN